MPDTPFGFLNINKPLNMTSHDVVNRVRRAFGIKKVGHAGTLDPLATGVLVICVGGATRLSEYVMHQTKVYRAHVRLGITTKTDDAEGDVVETHDAAHITRAQLESVLPQFTGDIQQNPPIYSAIKRGGRKLYELARAGEDVEIEPRAVRIDNLTIADWMPPECVLDVTCGSGTYIRSLARDIGEALGVGAHLSGLERTRSGQFTVDKAVSLEALAENPQQYLILPRDALVDYSTVTLDAAAVEDVTHGRFIDGADMPDDALTFAYDEAGDFIAILSARRGKWKPHKVFSTS